MIGGTNSGSASSTGFGGLLTTNGGISTGLQTTGTSTGLRNEATSAGVGTLLANSTAVSGNAQAPLTLITPVSSASQTNSGFAATNTNSGLNLSLIHI